MIKIYTLSEIEIPVVKNSLIIRSDNNAFSDSYSVYHNKYPFLIIESKETVSALGPRHLLTANQNNSFQVVVVFNNKVHFGRLKVLEPLNGTRKCDVRFGSELLSISDTKINTFFGEFYFNEETPYQETVTEFIDQDALIVKLEDHATKQYPEVEFQLPMITITDMHKNLDYYDNSGIFDGFNLRNFLTDGKITSNTRELVYLNFYRIINNNSFVPMPYLMALIEKPLASIGWKLKGDYKDNSLNSKVLIIPDVHNDTLLTSNQGYFFSFSDFGSWIFTNNTYVLIKAIPYTDLILGKHSLSIKLTNIPNTQGFEILFNVYRQDGADPLIQEFFIQETDLSPNHNGNFESSLEIEVTSENINDFLYISYVHPISSTPQISEFVFSNNQFDEKEMVLFHPTVDLKRFIPDWTFIELINNIKQWQNIKVDINELTKTLVINYNQDYITNFDYVDLNKYIIGIKSVKNRNKTDYKIAYENEDLEELENTVTIQNVFKIFDHGTTTSTTKQEFEKSGIGLAIYNGGIYTTEVFENKTLKFDASNGSLFHVNWKDWLTFRSNSSDITVEAFLPSFLISEIDKKQKVFFDGVMFAVKGISYEIDKRLNKITMELENIVGVGNSKIEFLENPQINISSAVIQSPGLFNFLWSFLINFSTQGLNPLNLNVFGKQLLNNPSSGINYSGVELTKTGVTLDGQTEMVVPLSTIDYDGWYEVYMEQDGIFSNKVYVELDTVVETTDLKIILTQIAGANILNPIGYFSIAFDGISPSSVEMILQKVVTGTGFADGPPIQSTIDNVNLPQYEIAFPSSGSWQVTVNSGVDVSNTLSWLAFII